MEGLAGCVVELAEVISIQTGLEGRNISIPKYEGGSGGDDARLTMQHVFSSKYEDDTITTT